MTAIAITAGPPLLRRIPWLSSAAAGNSRHGDARISSLCSFNTSAQRLGVKFGIGVDFNHMCWRGNANKSLRGFTVRGATSSPNATDDKRPSVGFLGLGIMGLSMARNLVKAGYDVTVWNRTSSKSYELVKEGAKKGDSPQQTAAACDITFAMVADPTAALAVACGEDGAVRGLGPNKGYVDVSTVDVKTSRAIAEAVRASGALFLEAPVSGTKKPAEDGTLIFLTAGDKQLYEQVSPILDVMGKTKFYLGEVGKGASMKLIVNMIMGSMMATFSEGLVLADKVGIDPSTLIQVIGQGTINAPMYAVKGPTMVKGSFPAAFPLKHQQKDLRLALEMAEEAGLTIPIATAANQLYKSAKNNGLGDDDFSAVIQALKSG